MSDETAVVPSQSIVGALRHSTQTMDLVIYWRSIAKRKWMILGLATAIAIATWLVVNTDTPIYRSSVTLLVEQNRARVSPTEEVYANVGDGREHFQTQAEILKARALAVKVVDKYDPTKHPDFDPRQREKGWQDRLKQQLGFTVAEPKWTEYALHEAAIGSLMGRMSVEPIRLSQLIKIHFESADPATAAEIANAIADTYIESDRQARFEMTGRASEWLGDRLEGLNKNVEDAQRALQAYREGASIINTQGLAQSGASSHIADLTTRLVAARQRRYAAEHAYNQVNTSKDKLDVLPIVMHNSLASQLRDSEREAQKRLDELALRYGPEHPRMLQAESELKKLREQMAQQVQSVVASLRNEYELAQANEKAVERSLSEAKSNVQSINRKEFELASLERAVATNRQIYDMFLNRFKETRASQEIDTNTVARVTDEARASQYPVKPKKEQATSVAFVLGILLGALISLLLERLDNTLKSADDVEEKLERPMLTMLPLLGASEAKSVGRHYLEDPTSVFSEAIRTARTGVLLSSSDEPNPTLLVTSSVPGEGKTAVAINFALAEAQTKRALLIDADLRRPSVAAKLGLDPTKPGLTSLLTGAATFEECLQRVPGSSLYAISAGPAPLNPLEMLLSQRFERLVKALAGTCDILIIDSPPVHLVSDALVLSKLATGVLFVVKADSTPYPLVRRCIRALEEVEARLFGVTLNQLDFKRAQRYYGAYTGSYYKYDGYTNTSKVAGRGDAVVPATS
ncbi:MAG: Tyrosine-protein kinase etk [Betaproteobacteria bacterium]|nr:Tyrosine-protein kinase etk [Betaproteobacteria bacterium]